MTSVWRSRGETVTRSDPPAEAGVYVFGDVRFDLGRFELQREGVQQRVEPQVLEVLAYLIRHRDRLVGKHELMDEVWHDRFVSESAVTSRIKAARRVTGDDGERQSVIRTVHGRGYRFVARLAELPGPAATTRMAAIRCVGRYDELDQLRSALAAAQSGHRRVVLLGGEPGIGKTTLIESFLGDLPPTCQLTGVGQCHPVSLGEPYAPVLEALAEIAKGPRGDLVRRLLDEVAPGWLLQLPALLDATAAQSLAVRTLGWTPERMLREALDLFDVLAASNEGPLILVVEDLHWADRATLDLATAAARRRKAAPLLLIGTYRHTEVDDGSVLSTVSELVVRGLARDIRLGPLPLAATAELVAQRSSGTDSLADDVVALQRRSGGNPLFIGALLEGNGAATRIAELPDSLLDIVERDLDALEQFDRELLETAAVAGTEFTVEQLGSGAEADEALRRCAALARRDRLISFADRDSATHFRFRHALYQEVTYSRIPPPRLRALHQVVGERLEAIAGDDATSAAELANHFTRSGDARRSIQYRLAAAGLAMARHAPAVALAHLRAGLQMLEQLSEGEDRLRFEADLSTGAAVTAIVAEGWAAPEAVAGLQRASAAYGRLGDTASAVRATYAMAGIHEVRGEYDKSRAITVGQLAAAAGDDQAVVQLHDIIACSTFHLGDFGGALQHAEEALLRYDPERDFSVLAIVGENVFVSCQHWAGFSLWFTGYADSALTRSDAAVQLARRPDHTFSLCHALEQAAMLRQFRREPDHVLQLAGEMHALAVERGMPYHEVTAGVLLAWARGMLGDPVAGCRELEESLNAYRGTGAALDLSYFLILLADLALVAGDVQACERALQEARALARVRDSFIEPEIERFTAALLLHGGASPDLVEEHLRVALARATERGAVALELRAAAELRRLQLATGRPIDAQAMLASIVDRFSEGWNTLDLREATVLLNQG
jgi:DNA-binding winged helix-turn-helix (wHTH) protein